MCYLCVVLLYYCHRVKTQLQYNKYIYIYIYIYIILTRLYTLSMWPLSCQISPQYVAKNFSSGIETGCQMADRRIGFRLLKGQELSLFQVVQNDSGAYPDSCPTSIRASLEVNRVGRKADQLPPTNDEVKELWIYTFTPPYINININIP
jgi:hypothetical protein